MAIDELAPGSSHERQARAAAWAGGAGSGGRGGARPQGERMTILGIDPGKSGAVAVLDEGGELLKVHDTPSTLEPNGRSATNAPLLASILARSHARIAYCEFVGARPTDAKVAAFAFGRARGVIERRAARMPSARVPGRTASPVPDMSKRLADIPPGAENKDLARTRAIARWPARADLFARKCDVDRAEAA